MDSRLISMIRDQQEQKSYRLLAEEVLNREDN